MQSIIWDSHGVGPTGIWQLHQTFLEVYHKLDVLLDAAADVSLVNLLNPSHWASFFFKL